MRLRSLLAAVGGLALLATGFSAPANAAAGSPIPVGPYVDMGAWPTPSLSAMSAASGVKGFTLAFVNSYGCKASWFGAYDPRTAWQQEEIAKIRSAGGDVKISFGGASGIELAQACSTSAQVAAEYDAVVKAYGLKYADFDIEGAAIADPTTIARRSQALKTLQNNNPGLKISLTLPVLPSGLTADGLNVVKSAKDAGVNVDLVNIMAMDYGRPADEYGQDAIKAIKSTQAQLKTALGLSDAAAFRILGVTPMLGENDDHGTFTIQDAKDVVAFANDNHLGYMGFWETNRDNNACTGALFQCTNVQQTPFEFSKIFAGFTG